MNKFTLHALACFDAVVTEGSFQAAAAKLHRTHPTIYAAIKQLEEQLGFELLDRTGYRVALTEPGLAFHRRARALLEDAHGLERYSEQLALGEESELTIVIGDLCPVPQILGLLRQFFERSPNTRMHLHFEALSGPWERLFDEEADLIIHHIDNSDQRLQFVELFSVHLIPVVAPGFLNFPVSDKVTPSQMRQYPQCIIRDSARHSEPRDYFVMEGAHSWTVADQLMKKELIVQGMGWGHMPSFLIEDELRKGHLLSLLGENYQGNSLDIVMARLRARSRGPVVERLWAFVKEQSEAGRLKHFGGSVTRQSRLARAIPGSNPSRASVGRRKTRVA